MANLRQKNGHYYVEFYDPDRCPTQKWVTLRTKDKVVAQQRLAERERAFARGDWNPWHDAAPTDHATLADAIKRYRDTRKKSDLSRSSIRADESILDLFAAFMPQGVRLEGIEKRYIERFLQSLRDKDRSNSTLHTYHTRLKHFFSWCEREGLVRTNPAAHVQKPKLGRTTPHYLERSEFDLLLKTIGDTAQQRALGLVDGHRQKHVSLKEGEIVWMLDVVRVAVGTGMRVVELCNMRWSWVSLSARSITVRRGHGFRPKSHHERHIPFGQEVQAVLTRLSEARGSSEDDYVFKGTATRRSASPKLSENYVSKRFKEYIRHAGLSEDYSFHTLRHTYASWLVRGGVELYQVKELLGHASIETTQRYAHLRPDTLRASVDRVF